MYLAIYFKIWQELKYKITTDSSTDTNVFPHNLSDIQLLEDVLYICGWCATKQNALMSLEFRLGFI